jgi:hypothetical protein
MEASSTGSRTKIAAALIVQEAGAGDDGDDLPRIERESDVLPDDLSGRALAEKIRTAAVASTCDAAVRMAQIRPGARYTSLQMSQRRAGTK